MHERVFVCKFRLIFFAAQFFYLPKIKNSNVISSTANR